MAPGSVFLVGAGRGFVSVRFRTRWFYTSTIAEAGGFAVPALTGLAAWRLGVPSLVLFALIVVAGAGEGAVLGFGQGSVLQGQLPGIRRSWVTATAAAAALAWAIGMLPSTVFDAGAPAWFVVVLMAPLAPALLCSIGVAQWLVLRTHVPGAHRWIWATAVAWVAALPPSFIAPLLVPDGSALGVWVAAYLSGGLLMATIMSAVTGEAMARILRRRIAA